MFYFQLAAELLRLRYTLSMHDRWSREFLVAQQSELLRRLRKHAYRTSPFYREFHRGLYDRPLVELPVLTKSMLMERFNDIVTDRPIRLADLEAHLPLIIGRELFAGRYLVAATSGSTGKRGIFPFDAKALANLIAGFLRGNKWAGLEHGLIQRKRMALIASAVPWHMSFRIAAILDNPWTPRLRLDAGAPLDFLVERLNAWQPEVMGGYPSSVHALAKEQLGGRLHIRPEAVFCGGEVLAREIRRMAKEAWGAEVFDHYGTTEAGNIAAECDRHRGLHISEDLLVVEVVDDNNEPVPPGRFGDKVLVTVLFNFALPLIRYELSDRVKLSSWSACSCGRPYRLIESIEGRDEEMLDFPASSGGRIAVHPLFFEGILDTIPAAEWQVVQEPDRLLVFLGGVSGNIDSASLIDSIRKDLADRGAIPPAVEVDRVPSIPRGVTGKKPFVKKTRP